MLVNAVIGAVVTVVSSAVVGPVAPILGGGVAGYLEQRDGPTVGALSGVIASLPVMLLVLFAGTFLLVVPDQLLAGVGVIVAVAVFLVVLLVGALLGALGGYLGTYIRTEISPDRGVHRSRRR